MGRVTVIGSINMDLTVSTDQLPGKGETVLGKDFQTYPGGKGANQAVAAARAGAEVTMIGATGGDVFGEELIENLKEDNVDTSFVASLPGVSTGTATIILSGGDNRIIVAPGANYMVTREMVAAYREAIQGSDVLLMQLETPMEAVMEGIAIAKEADVPVLLNPAHFQSLPEEVLRDTFLLTPNEYEYEQLKYHVRGHENVLITLGDKGVEYLGERIEGYSVSPVDTTGAGDTFNGVLAALISEGKAVKEAVIYANAASALSVTKRGAQSGMPLRKETEDFMTSKKDPEA